MPQPNTHPQSPEMQRYQELEQQLQNYTNKIRQYQAEQQNFISHWQPKLEKLSADIKELQTRPGREAEVKEAKAELAIKEGRISKIKQSIQKYELDLQRETESVRNEQQQLLRAITPSSAIAA